MINYGHVDMSDTIVALATPSGVGALGIIRVSGEKAIEVTNHIFHRADLRLKPTHTLHFGTIRENGKIIDEVVISLFKAPKSYTGENSIEISCHGSSYVIQKIIELLVEKGCRPARPGEFTMRAFMNGKMDLSQAESVADLIAADSEGQHNLAIQQMRGGYSRKMAELRDKLVHFASMIELELDFGEEDVEFADRKSLVDLVNEIMTVTGQMISSFRLGNVIKKGVTTVIAGRPNAGKSTLLNQLLKEDRAIVSEIPGTTRDTIEELINLEGILFRLIDTAGLREAVDKIEVIGVNKALEKIKQSALVLYVFDVVEMNKEEVKADLQKLKVNVPVIAVGNKTDLHDEQTLKQKFSDMDEILFLSSKTGKGQTGLEKAMVQFIETGQLNTENVIISNARHYEALKKVNEALDFVLEGIETQIPGELLATDIRDALNALGEITGEITSDELLGNIFGKFCIGK
jgi:tRNA modification GTPase